MAGWGDCQSCAIGYLNCDQCRTMLMYAYGANSVKCACCDHITPVKPGSLPGPQLSLGGSMLSVPSATSAGTMGTTRQTSGVLGPSYNGANMTAHPSPVPMGNSVPMVPGLEHAPGTLPTVVYPFSLTVTAGPPPSSLFQKNRLFSSQRKKIEEEILNALSLQLRGKWVWVLFLCSESPLRTWLRQCGNEEGGSLGTRSEALFGSSKPTPRLQNQPTPAASARMRLAGHTKKNT